MRYRNFPAPGYVRKVEPQGGLKPMGTFLAWVLLFILCWPLALLALVLYPVFWLLAIPFRLVGITLDAVFELLKALLFLPARILAPRRA
jgi:hypothetical protein